MKRFIFRYLYSPAIPRTPWSAFKNESVYAGSPVSLSADPGASGIPPSPWEDVKEGPAGSGPSFGSSYGATSSLTDHKSHLKKGHTP